MNLKVYPKRYVLTPDHQFMVLLEVVKSLSGRA